MGPCVPFGYASDSGVYSQDLSTGAQSDQAGEGVSPSNVIIRGIGCVK